MNDLQREGISIMSAPPQPQPSAPPFVYFGQPRTAATAINYDIFDLKSQFPVPWSSGLCDCCNDISLCCFTCWCPCITFGRIAEIVDRGSTPCGVSGTLYMMIMCLTGCSCLYSCFYRSKLRAQFLLENSPSSDCCIHCFCEHCALCQEYRELQHQGFDMSFGWHGNVEKQKRLAAGAAAKPPSAQGMIR